MGAGVTTEKKIPENSLVLGSEEDFDNECQPCCLDGKSVEAVGMCITCQEYLCQPCFHGHKLPKPCRDHELVKKDKLMRSPISSASKDKCTVMCEHHKDKVIEYHCVSHDVLGCAACITLNHRTCKDVVYIPKVAQDLDNNTLYQKVDRELLEMAQKSQNIDTLSTERTSKLETDSSRARERIQNFKMEIIRTLDKIEAKLEQNASAFKDKEIDKIMKLTDQGRFSQQDLENMMKKVQRLKSNKQNCDLYMYIVNIRSQLQPLCDQLIDVEHKLTITENYIIFKPNLECLETIKKIYWRLIIASSDIHVRESTVSNNHQPSDTVEKQITSGNVSKPIEKLKLKQIVDGEPRENRRSGWTFGLTVLSDQRVAIVDLLHLKIKTIDLHTEKVTSEMPFPDRPYDITLIEKEQVAVTLPGKKRIVFVNLTAEPKVDRYLEVDGACSGVDYRDGKLAVSYGYKVDVFNLEGALLYTINIPVEPDDYHRSYVALSQVNQCIYVSNTDEGKITCYSEKGELLHTYKDDQLKQPRKLITDSSGHVYVTDTKSQSVHQLTSDLRKVNIHLSNEEDSGRKWSLAYDESKRELYLGVEDKVKVYKHVNDYIILQD